MAYMIQCDLCKKVCKPEKAYLIHAYKKHNMDRQYGFDLCPECHDKIYKELKQEADN